MITEANHTAAALLNVSQQVNGLQWIIRPTEASTAGIRLPAHSQSTQLPQD